MPTYMYQCKKCDHEFDVLQKMGASPPKCEKCGKTVKKLITTPAVVFKASGCNDYPSADALPYKKVKH